MGFEPTCDGFANHCLTTWLPRRTSCSASLLRRSRSEQALFGRLAPSRRGCCLSWQECQNDFLFCPIAILRELDEIHGDDCVEIASVSLSFSRRNLSPSGN